VGEDHGSSRDLAHAGGVKLDGDGLDAPMLALLRAASKRGLRLQIYTRVAVCHGSASPQLGWYARASWDLRRPDHSLGGPWSVETAQRDAELGLIGIDVDEETLNARLTATGRRALKAATAPQPPDRQVPGDSPRDEPKPKDQPQ
jgi:hypothetical protein